MKIRITGDERDIANSAWVSTLNEVKAMSKTDEQVINVVKFLVENHHTSPFESVTLTLEYEGVPPLDLMCYSQDLYSRVSEGKLTTDLLNFAKVTFSNELWNKEPWQLFASERPQLAELVRAFGTIPDTSADDVEPSLGDHGMVVELVHLHDEGSNVHSRATWRVKCALSIAVQILRHRKGSYNMVSGRYRTITQEMTPLVLDVADISGRAGVDLDELYSFVSDTTIPQYLKSMKKLRAAKNEGLISNDEYKRVRECARFVLPEGRMTDLYVTYYLSDFYDNYKLLRDSTHAQTEHIWIAQEMERALNS